jgi:hypothetical protein
MSGDSREAIGASAGNRVAFAVLAVAWGASAGGLLGAAVAWSEIQMHGYADLGFWRGAASLLRESSLPAGALGACVAFVLALVWISLKGSRAKSQDQSTPTAKRPLFVALHRAEVLALVLAVTIACIGLLLERGMRPFLTQLFALLIAAFATWLTLGLAYQRG